LKLSKFLNIGYEIYYVNKKFSFWVEEYGGRPLTFCEAQEDKTKQAIIELLFDSRKKAIDENDKIRHISVLKSTNNKNVIPKLACSIFCECVNKCHYG